MGIEHFRTLLACLLDKTWEEISPVTIERAKWVIADTFFTAWLGLGSTENRNYLESVSRSCPDEHYRIPIMGTGKYTTPVHSSILMGASLVCNELDEGNQFAKGHPAAHVLPSAYIHAFEKGISGKEFIHAFIIGYEVASRLAYAANMKDYMHPHGTWGIVGGAVASAIIQHKTVDEIIESALLAATLPLATSWEAAVTGMTVRNLYTGIAGFISYQIPELQSYGYSSSLHVTDHLWGHIMSEKMNYDLLLKDLWEPPLIEKNYFKLYPACRYAHSAIDALLNALKVKKPDPSEIEWIDVETYSLGARMNDPDPQNYLSAKFSIPFLLACLVHGYSLYECYQPSVFHNHTIREFARKVRVQEDVAMTRLLPDQRAARIRIHLGSGKVVEKHVSAASGGFELPFPQKEMVQKFTTMLSINLNQDQANQVIQRFLQFESVERFDQFILSI